MAKAELSPIFNRLNAAPAYHPMTAETFADWSMEAGDLVTVAREGNEYTSPVGTSRMVWRGQQKISIDSTGTKEREAISRVSRRKYGRGGSAISNNNYIYNEVGKRARVFVQFTDPAATEDVHEGDFWVKTNNVETWNELGNSSWSYSSTFNWNDYKGALTYVRTAQGTWRLVSNQQEMLDHSTRIEQDENHISLMAQDIVRVDGDVKRNYAELKVEQSQIRADVVNQVAGVESHITQTASSIRSEVRSNYNGLSSSIEQTASSITSRVDASYAGLSSSITQTASMIRTEVKSSYDGLKSSITQTASMIRTEVKSSYDGLKSSITQTASMIRTEVKSSYDGLKSTITQTSSMIRAEVKSNYDGLKSTITQTASSITSRVDASYSNLSSVIVQTASSFSVEVKRRARVYVRFTDPAAAGLDVTEGDFWVKTNKIETWNEFGRSKWQDATTFNWNDYKGALTYVRTDDNKWRLISNQQEMLDHSTRIEQDENHISLIAQDVVRVDGDVKRNYAEFKVEQTQIRADVVNQVEGVESHITQTASSIRSEVRSNYNGLSSSIEQTASSITSRVDASYAGLSSSITQTASMIRTEVKSSYDGLKSSITQTASMIRSEVKSSYDGLKSTITQTSSMIRAEVKSNYDGLKSTITQTASSITSRVDASYSNLSSVIVQTASSFSVEVKRRARVYVRFTDPAVAGLDVTEGDFWVKTNKIETWNEFGRSKWQDSTTFNWNDYKGALTYVRTDDNKWRLISNQQEMLDHSTRIEQDEDHISLIAQDVVRVDGDIKRNYSELKVEQSRIRADVVNQVEGVESHITQTASSIRSEVSKNYEGLSSFIEQTASKIDLGVSRLYEGLESRILTTASSIELTVNRLYDGLGSRIKATASSIELTVSRLYDGLGSRIETTASSIELNVSRLYDGLGSRIKATASSIELTVNRLYDGLGSRIVTTASSIELAVNRLYDGLGSRIATTASSIELSVNRFYDGLGSRITATADAVGIVVEKKNGKNVVKRAAIVASINDNDESSVIISADKVDLGNYVTVGMIEPEQIATIIEHATHITTKGLTVHNTSSNAGLTADNIYFRTAGSGGSPGAWSLKQFINEVQVSGPVNDVYTLQYKRYNSTNWENSSTFSRATTLSGTWSGGMLNVTASPQDKHLRRQILSSAPFQDTTDDYKWKIRVYASDPDSGTPPREEDIGYNVALYNYLAERTFSSNGTYYPQQGYCGYHVVKVQCPTYSKIANIKCTNKTVSTDGVATFTFTFTTTETNKFSVNTYYSMHYND